MASQPHGHLQPASPDVLVTLKVAVDGTNRKFKLPVRELHASVFNNRMRDLLQVPANQTLTLERFSDSSAAFVPIDIRTPSSYKQLLRAGKAKLKLRLRASLVEISSQLNAQASLKAPIPNKSNAEELPAEPSTCKPSAQAPTLPPLSQMLSGAKATGLASVGPASLMSTNDAQKPAPKPMAKSMFSPPFSTACWHVCCNKCDKQVTNEHYHCSICDGGDFDLCESCVDAGCVCEGEGHWMIKRILKDSGFVSSTTEKIVARPKAAEATKSSPMPGAFNAEVKPDSTVEASERICNACIRHLPKAMVVSCHDCPDYDLCIPCLMENKHGHHPGHSFKGDVSQNQLAESLQAPGRNARHHAICDNCEKTIFGIRYKCLDCPDFDFCGPCHESKKSSHKHRFVPVYDPLDVPSTPKPRHTGIYCDGPLCNGQRNQSYIHGVRYKCAVCHDTDYCANCEAHPSNFHNKTHPMIKFKTMIKDVSVETINATPNGTFVSMGDRRERAACPQASATATKSCNKRTLVHRPSATALPRYAPGPSSETLPAYSYHPSVPAAMAPMAPMAPATPVALAQAPTQARPIHSFQPQKPTAIVSATDMRAEFVQDTVQDGSKMLPTQVFTQTWTLRNPGPYSWPSACSVRHIGGDYMLNVDQNRPGSVAELAVAQESNVTTCTVLPGQTFNFSVKMKAPIKAGKHISYWRLKSPDGVPFGHKLWCDIQVVATPAEHPYALPAPGVLSDYQMQMMLLEQQNKRRLMLAHNAHQYAVRQSAAASAPDQKPMPSRLSRPVSQSELQGLLEQQVQRRQQHQEHEKAISKAAQSGSIQENSTLAASVMEGAIKQEPVGAKPSGMATNSESTMVFPQLEKESPASSTHQDAEIAMSAKEVVAPPSVAATVTTETDSAIGEVVSAKDEFESDSDEEDDGFLTDEEYDILDASDEEIVNHGAF